MTLQSPSSPSLPRIVSAQNDILTDESSHRLIDFFSGNGAAFLGHTHPMIAAALRNQLDIAWITGGLSTPIHDDAKSKLESLLPPTHALARFYSTGMEAAEFAIRLARIHTKRTGIVGFTGAMHGKSAATAPLGWSNTEPLPDIHRLPFLPELSENDILMRLHNHLSAHPTAAVFLEPLLGSAGCHVASPNFCFQLVTLCHVHGVLAVFDEILTGCHRTGPFLYSSHLVTQPDIILLGKALANGFPASAVVARRDIPITAAMLPGSTFAGNPLAAAVIAATLDEFTRLDLPALLLPIEQAITAALGHLPGITLRGQGALWMLELAPPRNAKAITETLYRRGVFLSYTANFLRILPAATIAPDNLRKALTIVRETLLETPHA